MPTTPSRSRFHASATWLAIASMAVLLTTAPAARAETPPPEGAVTARVESPSHVVSLTISPVHLIFPIVELRGEYAVSDDVGVSLIAGAGSIEASVDGQRESFGVFELGAQLAWYAVGDFDNGFQLVAELLGASVSGRSSDVDGLLGQGIAASFLLGYKATFDFGLTASLQAGVGFAFARAEDETASALSPNLNLDIGWSF